MGFAKCFLIGFWRVLIDFLVAFLLVFLIRLSGYSIGLLIWFVAFLIGFFYRVVNMFFVFHEVFKAVIKVFTVCICNKFFKVRIV